MTIIKLVKLAVLVIIIILILNSLGMLNLETSKKVDEAVETTKIKISELKYKDTPITEMSLKELSSNISSDITYLKENVITEDGLKLSGKGLDVMINPTKERILSAQVDTAESKSVETIEKLLYNLTKKEIKVPDELLEKGNFSVVVDKIDGEFSVKFDK
ncbi:hypothetical protein [Tissierella sp.]|uniref:hypothetical protein n=1 Tax=Tissierella sp. TaxID=41274 RepID=UPI00285B90A8|nr:hypothetical protein [Tissierella sp.]MDR7855787.1 hypothetical protein [Tissierella sp.]